MPTKKVRKRKLNYKKLLILLLIIYLFGYGGYYIINEPIRNIIITGNTLVSDAEIIEAAGLKKYPSIFSISIKNIKKKLKGLTLIEEVSVKRDLKFRLKIGVVETKPLFLNITNGQIMLGNGTYTEDKHEYLGIPTLINYADEAILKEFAIKMNVIDYGILALINEIQYAPAVGADGTNLDENRFILYMNDGNQVYTNINKCKNLVYYREFYASIKNQKGILFLDSGNAKNFSFRTYESLLEDEPVT